MELLRAARDGGLTRYDKEAITNALAVLLMRRRWTCEKDTKTKDGMEMISTKIFITSGGRSNRVCFTR